MADLIRPPAQPPASAEGSPSLTVAVPGNEPEAAEPETVVGAIFPWGLACPCHLITAVSGALVCDDDEHLNGLEENFPRSVADTSTATDGASTAQPDTVAVRREVRVPPPEAVSGGENVIVPEIEQPADPETICVADAAPGVTISTPATTIDKRSHRTAPLPVRSVALGRTFSMTLTPAEALMGTLARYTSDPHLEQHTTDRVPDTTFRDLGECSTPGGRTPNGGARRPGRS